GDRAGDAAPTGGRIARRRWRAHGRRAADRRVTGQAARSFRSSTATVPLPVSATPMLIAVTPAGTGGRSHVAPVNDEAASSRGPSVQKAQPPWSLRAHTSIRGAA